MSWYYALEGRRAGPVTDEQFESLTNDGTIGADTLVWREGMENWQRYSTLSTAPAAAPIIEDVTAATNPAATVTCVECRQQFRPEDTVRLGEFSVCASCKPVYVQRLREGVTVKAEVQAIRRYGGFWIRLFAKFVDGLIVRIPVIILAFVVEASGGFFASKSAANPAAAFSMVFLQVGVQAIAILLSAAYYVYFVSQHQATPGKMICGLKIVNEDGSRVSAAKAAGRFFAEILSRVLCYIGYLVAGFDDEKRTLHDRICSTRVVHKSF